MADAPSILFITCSDAHPDDIIKLFLNVSDLPKKIHIEDEIYAYPWNIDNKYYTAQVNLCSFPNESKGSSEKFADSVEAVVLHFDGSSKDALEKVETCLTRINECTPEIKILVAENVPNDENSTACRKKSILEWCIGKGFELVELEPIIDDDDSASVEDDFRESTGIERIMQALNAHVWPNLVMKSSTNTKNLCNKMNSVESNLNKVKEKLVLEESLEELLEIDDFSHLFSQLSEMKAKVSSLSGQDRKEAAEQVVKAFWKAMGGEDSELE